MADLITVYVPVNEKASESPHRLYQLWLIVVACNVFVTVLWLMGSINTN